MTARDDLAELAGLAQAMSARAELVEIVHSQTWPWASEQPINAADYAIADAILAAGWRPPAEREWGVELRDYDGWFVAVRTGGSQADAEERRNLYGPEISRLVWRTAAEPAGEWQAAE